MPAAGVIAAFFGASLLLGLAPGPDNIFVLAISAAHGPAAGVMTTLGLLTGLCLQTLAVALGVAVIFQTSPVAFMLLKCAGCAYLLWLAWLELRAESAAESRLEKTRHSYGKLYRRGILMNVTNPKVCIFFLAFLPQFCDPARGPVFWQIIFFGLVFILAAAMVFMPVAVLGGRLADRLKKSAAAQLVIHRLAALVFVALAVSLLVFE